MYIYRDLLARLIDHSLTHPRIHPPIDPSIVLLTYLLISSRSFPLVLARLCYDAPQGIEKTSVHTKFNNILLYSCDYHVGRAGWTSGYDHWFAPYKMTECPKS